MSKTKAEILATARAWKARNKKRVQAYRKEYFQKNKQKEYKTHKLWLANHPGMKSVYDLKYRTAHINEIKQHRISDEFKKARNVAQVERYWSDYRYKKEKDLRSRVKQALRLYGDIPGKICSMDYLMGCTAHEYKQHIVAQFKRGMTWDAIEIDHIIPTSKFDLTKFSEVQKCFHYSNCQPLWPHENRKKGNR